MLQNTQLQPHRNLTQSYSQAGIPWVSASFSPMKTGIVFSLFVLLIMLTTVSTLYIRPAAPIHRQGHQTPIVSSTSMPRKTTDPTPADFYQTIIDANIFRPLGWREPVKSPQYQLIATLTASDTHKAILLNRQSGQLYTRAAGERIGEAIVENIEPKQVILKQNKAQMMLHLRYTFLR